MSGADDHSHQDLDEGAPRRDPAGRMLEARLRRFARVVESAASAIYLTDREGRIEYVNPAFTQITGYAAEEALGKTPRILKSGFQPPSYYDRLWSTILSGGEWREEVTNRRRDGSIYHALQTVSPFRNEEGEVEGFAAIQIDITQEKELERAVRESEERYRALVSSMREGVILKDAAGQVLAMNESATRLLGDFPDEMAGDVPEGEGWRVIDETGATMAAADLPAVRALASGLPVDGLVLGLERKDADVLWISANASPIRGAGGEGPVAVVVTFLDITERKRREEEVRRAAETDWLTGLWNRRKFWELARREETRADRFGDSLSLVMFDIDHFKRVNDLHGHDAGDRVLAATAGRARAMLREVDVLARWGGEEFLVLAPGTDGAGAMLLAERLRAAIAAAPMEEAGQVTASFGVARVERGQGLGRAIDRADAALYKAKEEGRNRSVLAPPD
jgi:diguanylate cyclase (GGDEF)-like protein/PAS domain S-box-containing protein